MRIVTAVFLAGLMASTVPVIAQEMSDTNMEILKQKLKADKKLLVAGNMDLSDADAKKFWPVYDAYQTDLQQVNQKLGQTHFRLRDLDPHERLRIDRWTKVLERHTRREMGSCRREQIAAVERAGHRLQRVVGVRELVGLGDAAEGVRGREEETVVGADVEPPLPVAQGESAPPASHAGIDDREVDARRHVRERVRQDERALQHMPRPDPVRDVYHPCVGSDRPDHAVARADEVVLKPEVREEGDDHGRERNASTSPSRS